MRRTASSSTTLRPRSTDRAFARVGPGSGAVVEVPPGAWAEHGDRRPFAVRHHLAADPRLEHARLCGLVDRLPAPSVEVNVGDLPRHWDADGSPAPERSPSEIVREIEALGRWMALKHVQRDPGVGPVVDEVLADVDATLGLGPATLAGEGYVFLSAARSVTPAHVDHEHNLLLQVFGTKTVTIGGFPDDASEAALLEGMHSGRYGRTGFAPHEPQVFHLEPGTGVYIPPRAVHLVENGDALSVSLSVVFHTPRLDRDALVYAVNAKLRRLGVRPRPPGVSATADQVKGAVATGWRTARRRTGRA